MIERYIRRIPMGTSLLTNGILVEQIDSELPTLYDCLVKILQPQMIDSAWEKLTDNVPLSKFVKKGTCVFILSNKAINYYNCLISNVQTKYEKTGLIKLIYSDDKEFTTKKLPCITKESQFDKIRDGLISYIKADNVYVIKLTNTFTEGVNKNIKNSVTDYLFYVPACYIIKE